MRLSDNSVSGSAVDIREQENPEDDNYRDRRKRTTQIPTLGIPSSGLWYTLSVFNASGIQIGGDLYN